MENDDYRGSWVFDENGRLEKMYEREGMEWEDIQGYYDNEGKLTGFTVKAQDPPDPVDSFVVEYSYENGHIASVSFSGDADVDISDLDAYIFRYQWNSKNRCTSWCAIDTENNPDSTPLVSMHFAYEEGMFGEFVVN